MRKLWLLSILTIFFVNCQSNPRYSEDVVALDNFDFGLNLDVFFGNEKYFRSGTDSKLSSSKQYMRDTSYVYYRYDTFAWERSLALAQYKDVAFQQLGLLSDSTDQQVLLIVGTTDYAKPKDVKTIVDDLLKIDYEPEIMTSWSNGTNIIFRTSDRIVIVYVDASLDGYTTSYISINDDYSSEEKKENILTKNKYEELLKKLANKTECELSVFVVDPTFDRIYNQYRHSGSSGFMVKYKTQ